VKFSLSSMLVFWIATGVDFLMLSEASNICLELGVHIIQTDCRFTEALCSSCCFSCVDISCMLLN
jgi:hypothetical protein